MIQSPPEQTAFLELAENYEATLDRELQQFWGVSYAAFVDQLLQFASLRDTDAILDIATGTGLIPRRLSSQQGVGGISIVGLDFTFTALPAGNPGTAASFVCGSALALPFAPGSFDCVICALATHHIDQRGLIEQARSVLKPGGQFILADVVAGPFWRIPGVKTSLRLAAFMYFLFAVSPARARVESQAVSFVHTEAEWLRAFQRGGFMPSRVIRPPVRRGWPVSAVMIAAVAR